MIQVETFEQTEIGAEGAHECEVEAIALIEKLGLRGQKALVHGDTVTRNPYRVMNRVEEMVYRTLYPERASIEDYRNGMIPLRVLQIAAHAKDRFGLVEVWSEATAQTDPVLVGIETRPNRANPAWGNERLHFILARWGEALEPFAKLREKAIEVLAERSKIGAEKAKADAERIIANPRSHALGVLNGTEVGF